ncbi:MAG: uroporphyrinogen-III synthase, partial [Methylibium sp.]|nr:uroporphyrinogen-III synthase [Methylibium sp.]
AAAIVEPAVDGGRFDSEALWQVLRSRGPWLGASVLIVRGSVEGEPQGTGREWLSQTLTAAGATVEFVAAYRRAAPCLTAAEQVAWTQAVEAPAAHLWLFSSSEAIDQLEWLAAESALHLPWAAAQALATHPRIAERARAAGFARVLEAPPTQAAIVAAIEAAQTRPIESDAP